MSWKEVSIVSQREQFYVLWQQKSMSMKALCELFDISRKTGYKWVNRGCIGGDDCFQDRSRKPQSSPLKTAKSLENKIIRLRKKYPDWGGRKLRKLLENSGEAYLPSASTITTILKRNGLMEECAETRKNLIRFEHESPNDLWQMDFKGHFPMSRNRCHPLTVLDDHSRFNIALKACLGETRLEVKDALTEAFERYGLPVRMTMDNGSPWGHKLKGFTQLTVWLMDLGIKVSHSRPYHPQTQGKDERFHRTFKKEVLSRQNFKNLKECQVAFDAWSDTYNFVRPHEAIDLEVPAVRYRVSNRKFDKVNFDYPYNNDDIIRKVNRSGAISYKNHHQFFGEAFAGRPVALRRTIKLYEFEVYYRHQLIGILKIKK